MKLNELQTPKAHVTFATVLDVVNHQVTVRLRDVVKKVKKLVVRHV